jgi:hypothetical protein
MGTFIFMLLFIALVTWVIRVGLSDQPLLSHTTAHWNQTVELDGVQPREFYESVKGLVAQQQIRGVQMRVVEFNEGGALSDKREYLRVQHDEDVFDLCAVPFGGGLYVSSWLAERPSPVTDALAALPVFGILVRAYLRFMHPETYYRVDSALLFQSVVHSCVLQALEELITIQGARPLSEFDRKPVMRELYAVR